MRLKHRIVSAATCLVAALTVVSGGIADSATAAGGVSCPPGLGIGLKEEPRALAKDPRAHQYVIDFVRPGASFSRRVLICNGDDASVHVSLYSAGAHIAQGVFDIDDRPGLGAVSQWVTVSPAQVDLGPHASANVTARFSIPADAQHGEDYGAIVAARPASPGGVALAARVAIRIYLAVGDGGLPPSDFTVDSLTAARSNDGIPYVQAQVHNTGKRAIDLSGSLRLSDGPGGLSAGPFTAKLGTTLAPGQTEPVTVPLDKALPAGPWHARIDLQSGLLKRAAEGTITFPTQNGISAPPVKAKNIPLGKDRKFLVPLALLLLLLLALAIFLLFWRRRRRDEDEEKPPTPATATA